ncbi:uncharacterized protein STEHIDRAFT_36630, partial [Stereum hirsutum FP-91666 SS1]|uniref:uncharacterized protein n=1 Tax=Stereum hirsutum (strain FP-91666) TaxID=721885 RepID=UPI000440C42D
MPRFLTGDELGNIKSITYPSASTSTPEATLLHDGSAGGKSRAIQALAVSSSSGASSSRMVAAACADGSASAYTLNEEGGLDLVKEWKEPRLRTGQKYVGIDVSSTGSRVYSCTSNGALRLTSLNSTTSQTAVLPMRLCDWRLSPDEKTFAYGGDEVELSVWDAERAFTASTTPSTQKPSESTQKKRKRDDLLPGETWRAKNVANDSLSLRQPVYNTCLTYLNLSSSTSQPGHHIATGTQFGNVRRYDTRSARRPVADWKGVAKMGGVRAVAKGFNEHELFVADQGCNLFSLDLRNGSIGYGYKGISGAITSLAPSPTHLASTALDRYTRIHSTFAPPAQAGQAQENKGQVLESVYVKSIPTVVVWDQDTDADEEDEVKNKGADGEDDEDLWEGMEDVEDED